MPVTITNENFQSEVIQSNLPVILDVYATWCGPCQQMAPIFAEVEKELGANYKFAKLNVDDARETSIKLGVSSVPTFIFMQGGQVKAKETGYMSKDDLKVLIIESFD